MLARLAFFITLLLALPAMAELSVKDVRLGLQEGGGTRFVIELNDGADYRLFLLDNPRRAVIDLPPLAWPSSLPPEGRGLVKGWRHGQFGSGTRIVLDLAEPVSVSGTQIIPPRDGHSARLIVDLAGATQEQFAGLINLNWGGRAEQAMQEQASEPEI